MIKIATAVSFSLWAAALALAPTTATAQFARMSQLSGYFACGTYSAITPYTCYVQEEAGGHPWAYARFIGEHRISMAMTCNAGCTGTTQMHVTQSFSAGRKYADYEATCAGYYLNMITACANCI